MSFKNWNRIAREPSSVVHKNSREDMSYYACAPKSQCMAFLPSTLSQKNFQYQFRASKFTLVAHTNAELCSQSTTFCKTSALLHDITFRTSPQQWQALTDVATFLPAYPLKDNTKIMLMRNVPRHKCFWSHPLPLLEDSWHILKEKVALHSRNKTQN